ncbi:hypothetical protein F5148DRAFT_1265750 [Russula earlei]|uniref:Uncharacterized protein n=1 Tax=Russula earlei TaxID=71964 RepID=A0ACC0TRC5_9AGAM|nr:hypothetical protein F5148DRAFT_1265750 [Russula earlei]
MRPFAHVLTIFCLAAGIVPSFAQVGDEEPHYPPLPKPFYGPPGRAPEAHLKKLRSLNAEMNKHIADHKSKLKTLEENGFQPDSEEGRASLQVFVHNLSHVKNKVLRLNTEHYTPLGYSIAKKATTAMGFRWR